MTIDPLLPHVRSLLSQCIESVSQLELLLFMHAQRNRDWSPTSASAELRSNPNWISTQLESLASRGLLIRKGEFFRYGALADLDAAVSDLARAYRTFPVTVVNAIHSGTGKSESSLAQFSEAFRLRRPSEPPSPEPEAPHG